MITMCFGDKKGERSGWQKMHVFIMWNIQSPGRELLWVRLQNHVDRIPTGDGMFLTDTRHICRTSRAIKRTKLALKHSSNTVRSGNVHSPVDSAEYRTMNKVSRGWLSRISDLTSRDSSTSTGCLKYDFWSA